MEKEPDTREEQTVCTFVTQKATADEDKYMSGSDIIEAATKRKPKPITNLDDVEAMNEVAKVDKNPIKSYHPGGSGKLSSNGASRRNRMVKSRSSSHRSRKSTGGGTRLSKK